jgi:hypothetical protein
MMKMWRVLSFLCGGIALVLFICRKYFGIISKIEPEHAFSRSGLDGLMSRHRKEQNTLIMAMLASCVFPICFFFARGPISFMTCLSAFIGCLLLIGGLFGQKQKNVTNFREQDLNVSAGAYGTGEAILLETLDGEVRRGEIIAYAARSYYLYPSALIATLSNLSQTPLIIPTKDIASLTHRIVRRTTFHNAATSPGYRYNLFKVCVYGRRSEKLGEVVCHRNGDAQFLITTLNRNFGVVNLGMTLGTD